MQFEYIEPVNAIVIDDFYTQTQLSDIFKELDWLNNPQVMLSPEELGTAFDETTKELFSKKNGVFLEEVFLNWKHSYLMSYLFKNMDTEEFRTNILNINSLFKTFLCCNKREHLLSYYENGGYYKPHTDEFFYTVLNYFHKEPKKFSGGEIKLYSFMSNEYVTIEPRNNRTVIIPSCTLHEVTKINSSNDYVPGYGRYCLSLFLTVANRSKK